ncbi:MAG: NIPSNAP family protein [Acidimicrobiales bacterium]|nr:NIPSNAP family protein [Acidimicrobiales bacterium]
MSFVEIRTYELKPGTANAYVSLYLDEGYEIQKSHLGEPVGYYVSEVGELNQIVHMWRYESLEERTEKRTALFSDPAWLEYVGKIGPMVLNQRNAIFNDIFDR